jgi:hypothetical protein
LQSLGIAFAVRGIGRGFDVPRARHGAGFSFHGDKRRILPDGHKTESFRFHDLAIHKLADTRRSFQVSGDNLSRREDASTFADSSQT